MPSNTPQPGRKNNVISVSAGSGLALSAELELLKKKFNTERTAQSTFSKTQNSKGGNVDIAAKVYKKGVRKSVKGFRNKLDKVCCRVN